MVRLALNALVVSLAFLAIEAWGYYDGAIELYEYGWAKSFHFSRFYKGESFVARHKH